MLRHRWIFMDSMIPPINMYSSYKLKMIYKTWQQKHCSKYVFKENQIFGFKCCRLVKTFPLMFELLLYDWYILTKLGWFQHCRTKIQFRSFLKRKFLGSHAVVLVKTFPLMYQLGTTVILLLSKLWWFQHFSTSQNSI